MRRALLFLCLSLATGVAAQDGGSVERLRARLARRPEDASLRCQLAFALTESSGFDEARSLATAAIGSITLPAEGRTARTLAACYYNRGLANEGLGAPREAAADYVASLRLRENETVLARLGTLVPNVPAEAPLAAMVAFEGESPTLRYGGAALAGSVTIGDETIWFVAADLPGGWNSYRFGMYAVRQRADLSVEVVQADEWSQEDVSASYTVEDTDVVPSDGLEVGVARLSGGGGGHCEGEEAFLDFEHDASVFVAIVDGSLRAYGVVTHQIDCERITSAIRRSGDVLTVTRSRGDTLEPGTYRLADLVRGP